MLNILKKYTKPYLLYSHQRFWSSSHSPPIVQINKQTTWLKYKTNRKLACIDGYQYTHIPLPQVQTVDVFPGQKNTPWYNIEQFFFGGLLGQYPNDNPFGTGMQGYIPQYQPFQSTFDAAVPWMYGIGLVLVVTVFRQYADINIGYSLPQLLVDANEVEKMADDRLSAKVNRIKELEQAIKNKNYNKKDINN